MGFAMTGLAELVPLTDAPRGHRRSDAVFAVLSQAIRDLRLLPGAPLSEPAVAAALNVSRSPVREAFTRLTDLGLLIVVPQVGSQVAPISLRDVEEAVFIRRALETSAFLAAIAVEAPDVASIQQWVDANAAAARAGDLEEYFAADERIHEAVFALAGMPRIWEVIRGTKLQLDRLRRLNLSAAILNPEVLREHQQIVDALRTRDAELGARVIQQHATRILTDTARLREANPEFFAA